MAGDIFNVVKSALDLSGSPPMLAGGTLTASVYPGVSDPRIDYLTLLMTFFTRHRSYFLLVGVEGLEPSRQIIRQHVYSVLPLPLRCTPPKLDVEEGFEPSLPGPRPDVLPLNYSTTMVRWEGFEPPASQPQCDVLTDSHHHLVGCPSRSRT